MPNLSTWLEGKKTYIFSVALVTVTVLYAFNLIDEHAFIVLSGLFGSGGLAALRSGQATESAKVISSTQEDHE